jgi:hypothetical protein
MLILAAAASIGWFVVPVGPVAVPAGGGVESLLWPLLPTVAVLAVPAVVATADGELERATGRPELAVRVRALAWCAAVLSLVGLLGERFDGVVVWRNTALLGGAALLASIVLPAAAAWQPLVLLPLVCWLLGTDRQRHIRGWAILLAPAERGSAEVAALVVLVTGVVAYLVVPWVRRLRACATIGSNIH